MKKLVIVVVVLAAVLLIAPYGIGKVAEKRMDGGLDKLVEQVPYFKIAERKWTRGWFKSEQLVTFELSDEFAEKFGKALVEGMAKNDADSSALEESAAVAQAEEEAAMAAAAAAEAAGEAGAPPADTPETTEEAPAEPAPDAAPAAEPLRFTVRNEVLHGPVLGLSGFGLARVDTHLDLDAETQKKIREVFGDKPAFEMSTRVGFFGGGTTTFKSEGRKLSMKDDDVELTYATFKMDVGMGRNADSYDIDGKLPSMVASKKSGETVFTMTDLTLVGDGERVMGDLYDGAFAFRIKDMQFKDPSSGQDMSLADLHYIVDTRTKDNFVDVAAQIGTGAVKSQQLSMIGVDLKEVHYNFSLRHLHAPSLDKMMSTWRMMYTSPAALADVEKSIVGPMKEHGTELLKNDPAFGIDRVGIVTPDGEIVAKGLIKLVGATTEDFSSAAVLGLVGKLDADITIEADVKAVEKLPNGSQTVEGALQSGYVERKGDKLVCHITFKGGELLVNGKPQAIPGLGGPPAGSMEEGSMEEDPNAIPPPAE